VRERLVLEVADDLLDDGVIAVLGRDERDDLRAVGDEEEVASVWPQLGLWADEACSSDDQPPAVVDSFGDLRLALLGVGDALPGVVGDLVDRGADGLDHPHADRVLPAGLLEPLEDLRVPEPRISACVDGR
jgi:hypothetical protein